MTIIELMEKAKARANLPSDYALAKALGIDRGIVSRWRKGKQHPSTDEAVQLATLAGLEEMPVIAAIEYEAATTEKRKEFWKNFLESRGFAHSIGTIALGVSLLATPEPAEANVLQLRNYDEPFHVQEKAEIYIMRISKRPISPFRLLIIKAICCKFAALLKSFLNTKTYYAFP